MDNIWYVRIPHSALFVRDALYMSKDIAKLVKFESQKEVVLGHRRG